MMMMHIQTGLELVIANNGGKNNQSAAVDDGVSPDVERQRAKNEVRISDDYIYS